MAEFVEFEGKIEVSDINAIESKIGLELPDQYKSHLLEFNGGRCTPNEFSFIENGKETTSIIDWFLAIYDGEYDNLEDYIDTYKADDKRLPLSMVPIAHDPGGNLILISCAKDNYGSIYFWDHEKEVNYQSEPDSNQSNIYFIAKDFNTFLDQLK